ncbi:hypothetical protein OHT76_13925 [Streptomyces sp. NBC_00287]|uniref:effector-associated constant component EACC1 n=1 Tax=Streptomyces sp. NBC_00287 TaxID=2975702 RepID=UPI002E2D0161|nr:hypothetical protein [Streptomyces sp. NBC_00287]
MDVQLRLSDDPDGGELKQLYDWLIEERESGLDAEIGLRTGVSSGGDSTMGDPLDIIQLVLESLFQLTSLGFIIIEFRRARRPRSHVIVERDGRRATLRPDATPEEVEAFLRDLGDMDSGPPDGTR